VLAAECQRERESRIIAKKQNKNETENEFKRMRKRENKGDREDAQVVMS
jgi:hypothetical protein